MKQNPAQILMMLLDDIGTVFTFEPFTHPITDEVSLAVEKKHSACCGLTVEIELSRYIMPTVTVVTVKCTVKVKGVVACNAVGRHPYLTPKKGQDAAKHEDEALRESIPALVNIIIAEGSR